MPLLDLQNLPDARLHDLERQLELYEQLTRDEGIHGLLQHAATVFKSPVILLDPDLRLITRASVDPNHPSICNSLATTGACRSNCRACFTDMEMRRTIDSSTSAVYLDACQFSSIPRILSKVTYGDRLLAYLLIFVCQDKVHIEAELELANTLAKVVSIVMRQRPVVTLFEEGEVGAFLAAILSGQQLSEALIEERQSQLLEGEAQVFSLLYLPSQQRHNEFFSIDYFAKQLEERVHKPHYLFKDGTYLLIFQADDHMELRGLAEVVAEILGRANLQATLGERFYSLVDLPHQLEVCELVHDYAQTRDQGSHLHRLGNHFMGMVMSGKLSASDTRLIHPDIKLLHSYDEENNASLLATWIAYLKAHKHLLNAAESLGIHKNTLVYRLKRISEMTVSLNDDSEDISYQLLSNEKIKMIS